MCVAYSNEHNEFESVIFSKHFTFVLSVHSAFKHKDIYIYIYAIFFCSTHSTNRVDTNCLFGV